MEQFPTEPTLVNVLVMAPIALTPTVQILLPIFLLVCQQPRREGFGWRAAASLAALLGYGLVLASLGYFISLRAELGIVRYGFNFFGYTLLAGLSVGGVLACYETSVWNALSCASAGYALQNLASGLLQLVGIVLRLVQLPQLGILQEMMLADMALAIVLLVTYPNYIRRVQRAPRLDSGSRSFLAVFVVVILAVISYDVVIRALQAEGTDPAFLLTLRIVHATVCLFVVWADYELLYNARLRQNMTTSKLLMAERERQYQLSRENIAAINTRTHAMRHEVFRLLDAEDALTSVSREGLGAMLHELDVYDAKVQTGNTALDTVLTEKSLVCRTEGITLTCMADGHALDAVEPAELYVLFGGLLDEAIAAARDQADASLRSISLSVRCLGQLALVHLECYGLGGTKPSGSDAGPLRRQVEAIGGTLTRTQRGDATVVDVMLPVG